MTQIIVSLITGGLTLIGVCVTAWASARSTRSTVTAKLETAQAVTDTKIDALTREVRTQNELVRKIPVMEVQLQAARQQLAQMGAPVS